MTNALYGALLVATVGPAAGRQPGPAAVWVWPVQPPVVVRAFDPPPTPYAAGHRGVDLAAVAGQPVETAGAGVVSFAGQVAGIGVVVVRHDGGLRTTYEPVAPAVAAGQQVAAGAVIGHVTGGHLGCTVCLHFGLRSGVDYLDPLSLFARGPVRLLPVDGPPGAALSAAPVAAVLGAAPPAALTGTALSAALAGTALSAAPAAAAPTLSTPRRGHLSLVPALGADLAAGLAVTGGAVTGGLAITKRRTRRRPASP